MSDSLAFITGTSGFIGAQVLALALEEGYRARLSVRREAQIADIRSRYPDHASKLEFVVIPDLTDLSALKDALKGVEYIIHVASPMPSQTATDLKKDYVDPAVKNTTNVLDAAAVTPTVKRVVITASALSVIPQGGLAKPGVVAEEGTNRNWKLDEDTANADPSGFDKYYISKLLAHRATLDWAEAHKSSSLEVASVLPSFVIGTDLTQKGLTLQGVNGYFWTSLGLEKLLILPMVVDVRDVAAIHVRALKMKALTPGAVTEFIADGHHTTWEEILGFLKSKYPSVEIKLVAPFPEAILSDTTRAERDLGIKWHAVSDLVSSVMDQQLEKQAKV
ncbi:NAD dependent epimerase dehydratase family protein [Grosmannia clavigera kw1407]|uniref:NAD dependent epimerase dehydratase family protein n=1 Tax=Grosmannia clavigera (strain kw1407 / UAMH 11150) TaxID=655863 RepID=F0XBI8_GROCL|nr:NAD dependent epimerase dehydratase family protein [Grosmannia clavigera kw1407]EFX05083.1 NAD dependent epimerase dehydratase family protein [Grosmannia clavigera kw1407]